MPICLERLPALFKETKCPSKIFTLQTSAEDARCLDQQLAFLKLPVSPYSVQSNASSASAGGRSRQCRQLRGVLDDCLARNTSTEGSLMRLVCASKVSKGTGTAKVDVDYLVASGRVVAALRISPQLILVCDMRCDGTKTSGWPTRVSAGAQQSQRLDKTTLQHLPVRFSMACLHRATSEQGNIRAEPLPFAPSRIT
jgi:hypothetical protein